MKRAIPVLVLFGLAIGMVWSQREAHRVMRNAKVGPVENDGFLLPSGWTLRPAGRQVALDTLPLAAVATADGKGVLILQSGYNKPTLSFHSLPGGAKVSAIELEDSFHGLVLDGKSIYIGGGSTGSVYQAELDGAQLRLVRTLTLAANPPANPGSFIGDLALAPDKTTLYAADITQNLIFVVDLTGAAAVRSLPTGRMPYRILFHPSGREFLVSSWADGEVLRHARADGAILQRLAVGAHTTDMIWQPAPEGARLFVAAAHTNDVYMLSSAASGALNVVERLNVSLAPRQPLGMTPSALAFSNDRKRLFIACSDANAIAVADVSGKMSRITGFLPVGWYPTAMLPLGDDALLVLNGKGVRSLPNPNGPGSPKLTRGDARVVQHVGRIHVGGMSVIAPFDEKQLALHTRVVYENSPYRDLLLEDAGSPRGSPIPNRPGEPSPIKHVIYIVKENRTYDQVFGDMERGNGDPSLTLFKADCSPNHRKLSREFVLFDNFYVNGDVSADGHNWSAGAISPDVTTKIWPNMYGGRKARMSLYWGRPPHNFTEDATRPHGGYLWTRAFEAGVSVRNYGWLTKHKDAAKTGETQIVDAESRQLMAVTNPLFRGFDVAYPDLDRMQFFLDDLAGFEKKGDMPRLIVMRLGNDHTAGMRAGAFTPRAMFADNDLALARLVEAVSKSRFWRETAIFVLEDDAQSGPDHVDSHRSPAFVISPYAKRRSLDSNMYNTVSMLRTMELILGLKPMTHFDAAAEPMHTAFTARPDFTPYSAVEPTVSRLERNPSGTPLAARSARLDLSEADLIDDRELNDILYLGLQNRPAPVSRRSFFYPGSGRGGDETNEP